MIGSIRDCAVRMSATARAEVITVIVAHLDHLGRSGQRLVTRNSPRLYTAAADLGNGRGRRVPHRQPRCPCASTDMPTPLRQQRSGHTNAARTKHDLTRPNSAGQPGTGALVFRSSHRPARGSHRLANSAPGPRQPPRFGPRPGTRFGARWVRVSVDHTWQNKNRVFPVQGPSVMVTAVRRRATPTRS